MAHGEIPNEAEASELAVIPLQGPSPLETYRDALRAYDGAVLHALALSVGLTEAPSGRLSLSGRVAERLGESSVADRVAQALPIECRLALSLFAVTETYTWPAWALRHALRVLGVEDADIVSRLIHQGLLAVSLPGLPTLRDPARLLETSEGQGATLHAHPAAVGSTRTVLPPGERPPPCGPVTREREADGLEPTIRLAALWQRVEEAPLRQTQQGTLYKRDRDRLEDDTVLAGPIADAIEPIPDMPAFWLALAVGVGLLETEPGLERIAAASPDYWADHAIHLPRMVALRWLSLRHWHEQGGIQREGALVDLALPYVRAAVLLWLAASPENEWVAVGDLAAFLRARSPLWAASTALELVPRAEPANGGDNSSSPFPAYGQPRKPKKSKARSKDEPPPEETDVATLSALLLGVAYQIGLVRVAQEAATGRTCVQLAPLGRYLLAIGPPPPARPAYEHFLFVQPNFEVIAYRQGLTPRLVGQFSRFTLWTQAGAALAMRLTPESVYRGLEGGLSPEEMTDLLARHSPRPLPAGIAEALRTWSGRRDRVSYHAAATLVEFATPAELEAALAEWPAGVGPLPLRVSERLLLVEDEATIPWSRFRSTGSRNYRLPAEACVEVEHDGVTLTLDLARSDLLVDAELTRIADEVSPAAGTRRRFIVSADSLARAEESGLTQSALSAWFLRRTGADLPPSIRLLLAARAPRRSPLTVMRPVVLQCPSPDLLDGLAQHPQTKDYLGTRLGPNSVVIPELTLASFRQALERLGLSLDESTDALDLLGPAPKAPVRGAKSG